MQETRCAHLPFQSICRYLSPAKSSTQETSTSLHIRHEGDLVDARHRASPYKFITSASPLTKERLQSTRAKWKISPTTKNDKLYRDMP